MEKFKYEFHTLLELKYGKEESLEDLLNKFASSYPNADHDDRYAEVARKMAQQREERVLSIMVATGEFKSVVDQNLIEDLPALIHRHRAAFAKAIQADPAFLNSVSAVTEGSAIYRAFMENFHLSPCELKSIVHSFELTH